MEIINFYDYKKVGNSNIYKPVQKEAEIRLSDKSVEATAENLVRIFKENGMHINDIQNVLTQATEIAFGNGGK